MNGVRVTPAPAGCTCPSQSGFGASSLHFATYSGCALNKPVKACQHEHAHRLMQRCGWCGWVNPAYVVVKREDLERLLQHGDRTRSCCREAAAPIRAALAGAA